MEQRVNIWEKGKDAMGALYHLGKYLSKTTIEKQLLHLLYYRVSQINSCGFCLDMHSKDFLAMGENPQRLYVLDAWREAPFYSDRERAALAYAESLTKLGHSLVPDDIYQAAAKVFSEQEMIDLTISIIAINSYNRINIAFGAPVGSYKVGQYNQ